MKSKRRWFVGLALALPLAALVTVLLSMQPASADTEGTILTQAYYGAIFDGDGNPVNLGEVEILAHILVEGEEIIGDPVTTSLPEETESGETTVYGSYFDGSIKNLLIEVDDEKVNDSTLTPIYVEGAKATEFRICGGDDNEVPGQDINAGEWKSIDELTWEYGSTQGPTCIDLKAGEPPEQYTLTVSSGVCCTVTVDGAPVADGEFGYSDGTVVNLGVITGACCKFDGWTVDSAPVAGNSITVTMDGDHEAMADCALDKYNLKTSKVDLDGNTITTGTVDLEPSGGKYDCGTTVTATASTDASDGFWVFDHWSGTFGIVPSDTNPITVNMGADKWITATFVEGPRIRSLVITSTECFTVEVYTETGYVGAVAPGGTDEFTITANADVTLTTAVTPGQCCSLNEWQRDDGDVSTEDDYTFIMDADYGVVVDSHGPPFFLAIDVDPAEGGSVTEVPGTEEGYECGDPVTLTAVLEDGWQFAGWLGDDLEGSMNQTETLTMDEDKDVIATFQQKTYTVTFPSSDTIEGGEIEIEPPEGPYTHGTEVTIEAVPDYCYEFMGWTGDLVGYTETVVTLNITGSLDFDVEFQRRTQMLELYADPVEGGSVMVDPPGGSYSCCTWVTLTAQANVTDHYEFVGWTGSIASSDPVTEVHIGEENLVITGVFQLEEIDLSFDANPEGGTVDVEPPDGPYQWGQVVTITANPDEGWQFSGWLTDLVSYTDPIVVITLTEDLDFEAVFEEVPTGPCFTLEPSEAVTTTPLAMHIFELMLTNESCGAGSTFDLDSTKNMWPADPPTSPVHLSMDSTTLDEGMFESIVVTMTVPEKATDWMTGTVVITATTGGTPVTTTLKLWTGGYVDVNDVDGDGNTTEYVGCRFDANFNGLIDGSDIGEVSSKFPQAIASFEMARYNYNHNDVIDGSDIGYVSSQFPNACQAP